jgi:hypothetical protein
MKKIKLEDFIKFWDHIDIKLYKKYLAYLKEIKKIH